MKQIFSDQEASELMEVLKNDRDVEAEQKSRTDKVGKETKVYLKVLAPSNLHVYTSIVGGGHIQGTIEQLSFGAIAFRKRVHIVVVLVLQTAHDARSSNEPKI